MILCNNIDIEKDSIYSFLLGRLESPEIKDIITVANKMLQLYDGIEVNEKEILPTEYFFLHQVSKELGERVQCIDRALESLEANNNLNCEEISVVDYGCGQGFASLSVLEWFLKNKGHIDNIKNVKIIDKDSKALKIALLHFSVLFPSVNVIAYEQDFLEDDFCVKCDSVLTLNLFSHVISDEFKLEDRVKDLISKGHNILMHNIIIEEISSKSYP
jgi:2-polyprenyl-3-methyl-5-hydroxy-6-metoxy-1,4-benzoquinol methylase